MPITVSISVCLFRNVRRISHRNIIKTLDEKHLIPALALYPVTDIPSGSPVPLRNCV